MAKITLARALKERKTIISKIAETSKRVAASAVTREDVEPDFNTQDQIKIYIEKQSQLRLLKSAIAKESSLALVKIPESVPVVEAGKEVSVSQAVLIRDDLKGLKSLLDSIVASPVGPIENDRYGYPSANEVEKRLIRRFDLQEALNAVEKIQEAIDAIDSIIQYKNNNYEIEI